MNTTLRFICGLLLLVLAPAAAAATPIAVAFVVTEGANVIDFAGPWEVFQDTPRPGTEEPAFRLFTVGESRRALRLTGGLTVVPDYTFDDAPAAAVVVVGAQGRSDAMIRWLRRIAAAPQTEVLMSVCTGAFKLAEAGVLDGKHATTHHDFFDELARRYPAVIVERGPRFVQAAPRIYTAGGLTSGVDLALHIVERYFGAKAAADVATYMEYRGR
jgi:transcriptional regulator GlxA family with amidase domain